MTNRRALPFQSLARGGGPSRGGAPFAFVVCDHAEALRAELPGPAFPDVDFAVERAVVMHATCADTSWGLHVTSVELDDATQDVVITFLRASTGGVALQVITRPSVTIAIPRTAGRVEVVDGAPPRERTAPPRDDGPGERAPPRRGHALVAPAPAPPPFGRVAWWQRLGRARAVTDTTGRFTADNLGMVPVALTAGDGLAWRAAGQALRIPQAVLDDRVAGVIVIQLMREDADTPIRLFGRVRPGEFSELGIHINHRDRCTFVVSQRQPLVADLDLPIGTLRRLVFAWGPTGKRILADGVLLAEDADTAGLRRRASVTELGRDPNNPERTGSRGVLFELAIYEGLPPPDALAAL